MKTLDDIACLYQTDKCSLGHGYTSIYAEMFWPLRDAPITLLEIGVWEGASMAMWREYFTKASIVGVDVDTGRARGDYIEGTHIRQADVTDEPALRRVIEEFNRFDVIIDDGAHLSHIARHAFRLLWPHLAAGGIYCVEDIHTYWWPHANTPGCEEWLFDLARDCVGRGDSANEANDHPTDIHAVGFYKSMAVIKKRNR